MIIVDYTTQYIGEYSNPMEESLQTNQYFMEWEIDCVSAAQFFFSGQFLDSQTTTQLLQ